MVAVIGGGVVGAAVAYTLVGRGVDVVLLEARDELGLGASGTNSGILHTGFDSVPGALETRLLLRATQLRDRVLGELCVPALRCGALLRPQSEEEVATVAALADNARKNDALATLQEDGTLDVPDESVTDPVAFTRGLAAAAELRTRSRVESIQSRGESLVLRTSDGDSVECAVAVNAAGLHGDEVARMVGDDSFEIYPRKGEFFVFARSIDHILLPIPTKRTKGVLVFPTVDGKVVAGPTAHDQEDKEDWSVRPEAWDEVMPKAVAMLPELEGAEPIASYAGLRPAGRGVNYVIGPSAAERRLINVAAIRSTGMSASLGIAEHVTGLVAEQGVELAPQRELHARAPAAEEPWWRKTR